uniref:SET domain-containing protein n=1 Tax=Oryza punctata TaxID=4537 RepID=A0A0E0KD13_ORYPU
MDSNQHKASDPQDYMVHLDLDEDKLMVTSTLPCPSIPVGKSIMRKRGRPRRHAQGTSLSSATPEGYKKMDGRPYHLRSDSTISLSNSCLLVDDGSIKLKRSWELDKDDLHIPFFQISDHPRESVDDILMTFGGLHRRIIQLKDVKRAPKQLLFQALNLMGKAGYHVNKDKRVGEVPGVKIGDIFYSRIEMFLVGLHSNINGGIEFMSGVFVNKEDKIATCIVSSGMYENDDDDPYTLVYNGQGKVHQKLERGNYSLNQSFIRRNHIRVIRSEPNPLFRLGSKEKIYIYDGLYKIEEKYRQTRKSRSNLKFKLVREPGLPDGIVVWKNARKWRENPSCRDHVIVSDMSNGAEMVRVCVVNNIDNEDAPNNFTYSTKLDNGNHMVSANKMCDCKCTSSCLGEDDCSCLKTNGSYLPYSSSGILVCRKTMIYECNDSCACTIYCSNRVVQRGPYLHFEVFKTMDRGWGLRSWDPIPTGAFVCEYAGVVIDKDSLVEEDEYIFEVTRPEHNLKWNYIPELIGEPSFCDMNDTFKKLPTIISAKQTGNIARFMNHSCSPNVFYQPVMYDHGDEDCPHIAFFAIKNIPPMTELTYDYGQSNDSGCRRPKICICQSHMCKGTFG